MNNHYPCDACPNLVDADTPNSVVLMYLDGTYYEEDVAPRDAHPVYLHEACADDLEVVTDTGICQSCGQRTELHAAEKYKGRIYEPGTAPVDLFDPADGCDVVEVCEDCLMQDDVDDWKADDLISDPEYR